MKRLFGFTETLSRGLNVIGGLGLVFIVLITTSDVILRAFRLPILGTYEIVSFTGCIVVLFALPLTSWLHAHIYVDFVVEKFSPGVQKAINVCTRCLVIFLFILFAWNLMVYGMDLQRIGEVSPTLKIPFYPVVYAAGVCCFVQCLVLVCDVVKIFGGRYGE
jgi:TRAP-type C4-dicarboxylate transport system permease small subunit